MPFFGGMPWPRRFGGHKPKLKVILESLNQNRGSAYDVTQPSNVYLENMAIARAVHDVWSANARLANQWDPIRMTDFFQRWEAILQVPPAYGDTVPTRRQRIAGKLKGLSGPTAQVVSDACSALLGSLFVQVEFTSITAAVMHWPVTSNPTLWDSTVAHILVRVTQPSTVSDSIFLQRMNSLTGMLDAMLPSWTTFDWAATPSSSSTGFILDDAHNLDYEAFDS